VQEDVEQGASVTEIPKGGIAKKTAKLRILAGG